MDAQPISPDRPLSDPADDKLGVAPFAKMLANAVQQLPSSDGTVIAIHGAWGSGKSTALGFVLHYLNQADDSRRPEIVAFNPWWFSGGENLTLRYFEALLSVLKKWKTKGGDLARSISRFALAVSDSPIPGASYAKAARVLDQARNVQQLKEALTHELRKQKKRFVVVIDDIDRLAAQEIRELFKVVKAVGDLPGITYVLAFDRKMVTAALHDVQGTPGEEYLEKIVQAPFELPPPDKVVLRDMFLKSLNALIAPTKAPYFDQLHWGNVFFDGIDPMLETPRDVIRLISVLGVTHSAVVNRVNTVDFIALEALRLSAPVTYELIRGNKDRFTGALDTRELDQLKRFHSNWADTLSHTPHVTQLVRRLFPKVEAALGGQNYGSTFEAGWRRSLRICSADRFEPYFRLAIPVWDVSALEMDELVDVSADPVEFGNALLRFKEIRRPDGVSKLRVFLDRFLDYTDEHLPLERIGSVLRTFADVGDDLLETPVGFFEFGNDTRIGRITWRLARRLDRVGRLEALSNAIQNGRGLATIVHWMIVLEQEHGKLGERQAQPAESRIVDEHDLQALEELTLTKIRTAAQDGTLAETGDQLPMILHHWRFLADVDEVRTWVSLTCESEAGLVKFVACFFRQTQSYGIDDRVGRTEERLNPNWIKDFIDVDGVARRLAEVQEEVGAVEQRAVAQFLKEYDLLKRGKDPDDPFFFEPS